MYAREDKKNVSCGKCVKYRQAGSQKQTKNSLEYILFISDLWKYQEIVYNVKKNHIF